MYVLSAFVSLCILNSSNGGILRTGNPLHWNVAKPVLQSVRLSGIKQFIYHYNRSKDIETPLFLWGDEIEYGLFGYDSKSKRFDLSPRGREIREQLSILEKDLTHLRSGCEWQPEYGSWMIEAVPRDPYGGYISDLLLVEKNMQLRRKRLHAVLRSNEIAPTTANFPMMGVEGYDHTLNKRGDVANSAYISDEVINPHPRFGTLTRNIRLRRLSNVNIRIPLGTSNINKLSPFVESSGEGVEWKIECCDDDKDLLRQEVRHEKEGQSDCDGLSSGAAAAATTTPAAATVSSGADASTIHMDAMAFGMGCCCLQVTMQANDDRESRFVHDQLALLAPLFLALSASTPIFKGQLAGTDTRWDVISQSVDDRTDRERGLDQSTASSSSSVEGFQPELVAGGVKRLSKSRYSSVSCFIGKAEGEEELKNLEALNDMDPNMDAEAFDMLLKGGLDRSLAAHIAHLFVRDPLVIFDDAVVLDDRKAMDHFENIQSTNWRTMRWKSPSLEMGLEAERRAGVEGKAEAEEKDIQTFGPGWRVEFRPLEIQLTDFENAAFSLLTVLATRSLLAMGYNFYLPVSLMEENMNRAQAENAVMTQKFWVRKESFSPSLTTVPLTPGKSRASKNKVEGVKQFGTIKRATAGGEGTESAVCLVPRMDEITAIELSLNDFFNGRQGTAIDRAAGRQGEAFPGLIPAIYGYLEALGCDALMIGRLRPYLTLLQKKASGELPTTAQWIRNYVRTHPDYTGDGKVPSSVANDLLMMCDDIGMGRVQRPDLVGDALIELLCPDRPLENPAAPPSLLTTSTPAYASASPPAWPYRILESSSNVNLAGSAIVGDRDSRGMKEAGTGVGGGAAVGVKAVAKKLTCVSYTPISVCSRNVVTCFRGDGEEDEGTGLEPVVQVPWIAHVLMGSGADPDTYLDIKLIQ